eukprot:XP_011660403.1 PREDICTED: proline-rich extensin-like protein EPR1 [Strongylocentrotus purpuratus]
MRHNLGVPSTPLLNPSIHPPPPSPPLQTNETVFYTPTPIVLKTTAFIRIITLTLSTPINTHTSSAQCLSRLLPILSLAKLLLLILDNSPSNTNHTLNTTSNLTHHPPNLLHNLRPHAPRLNPPSSLGPRFHPPSLSTTPPLRPLTQPIPNLSHCLPIPGPLAHPLHLRLPPPQLPTNHSDPPRPPLPPPPPALPPTSTRPLLAPQSPLTSHSPSTPSSPHLNHYPNLLPPHHTDTRGAPTTQAPYFPAPTRPFSTYPYPPPVPTRTRYLSLNLHPPPTPSSTPPNLCPRCSPARLPPTPPPHLYLLRASHPTSLNILLSILYPHLQL